MDEQVLVRMGLDQRPLLSGLRSVGHTVDQWSQEQARSMSRFFSGGIRGMFAGLTAAGMLRTLKSTADQITSLRDNTEELQKQFGKLTEAQIAAAVAISDNFSRAERTLKGWMIGAAGGVMTLVEAVATSWLTGMTLREVQDEMAGEAAERMVSRAAEMSEGRVATAIEQYRKMKAEIEFDRRNIGEQMAELEKRRAENTALIHDRNTMGERQVELATENLRIERQLERLREREKKEREDARRAQDRQLDQERKLLETREKSARAVSAARNELASALRDLSSSSLSEIAESTDGFWGIDRNMRKRWFTPPGRGAANEVMRLEREARRAALWGEAQRADEMQNRALQLRQTIPGLSEAERDPLGMFRRRLEQAQLEASLALKGAITADGAMVVTPQE